jgi:hypothetical protein
VSPPPEYSASRYEVLNGDQLMDNGVVYKFMQLADRDLHPDNFQCKLAGTVLRPGGPRPHMKALTPAASRR